MMWSVVILLTAALSVESYAVHDLHERLAHGRQLKIYLPKNVEKLVFTPADEPGRTIVYWERGRVRTKGRVSGSGNDRRWYIDKVTYEDQGMYIQKDFWDKEISTVKVAITPRHNYVKCVAGESLHISLEGIDLADALLSFSSGEANVTLVRDGARVSQDLPDYWDRVQTHSMDIEIKHVNYSDEGRYTLRDRRDRMVSITRMDLTGKVPGQCAVLLREGRFIYYLVTKQRAFHKPTYSSLLHSLEDMRSHCIRNGVHKLSMPRIGCGLDQLEWVKVAKILEQVFMGTGITITIYSLPWTTASMN